MAKVALEQCNVEKMICLDNSSAMLEVERQKISSSYVEFLKLPMEGIDYDSQFDVISSILVNHYLSYEERMIAVRNCYHALKEEGIYIIFENFTPCDGTMKKLYLKRWEKNQYSKGKSIKECGFRSIEIFWCSYMQVGILARK